MKRSLLSRLRSNGAYYLIGALLLLVGIPLYQILVLVPLGYGSNLHFTPYLVWIHHHSIQFIIYRVLLITAFALLLTLPFTLFRIIVAQELIGQLDDEHDGMPADAWRGKGFVVLAAWSGLAGLVIYIVGTIANMLYLTIISVPTNTPTSGTISGFLATFSVITNTIGIGFLALAILFFGAMIARSGHKLWPGIWVAFGYVALAVAALLSGSAVAVANAPTGQAALTSPAIFLFGLWVLWLGGMLVRLRPE